ncbi:MAG: ABC transporter ATP-binding protein [Atopobiaceae bacterium]|jgi:ABC-type sugar transport system ATPase subunit
MSELSIVNLNKRWKGSSKSVLEDINLTVGRDFCVLLGPSGSGKSTLLRTIAGLEEPDSGRIFINGTDVTDRAPQDRKIGMVFQNYALFPHMAIGANAEFPLKVQHMRRDARKRTVSDVLKDLEIADVRKRHPYMLSGGQRQRAAMARAMVQENEVYLFDEPMSNLDESLRARLRPEIQEEFERLQVPFLYVTHDQVDALTLATKVAIMAEGRIVQVGMPQEVYEHPATIFVAEFMGNAPMNICPCTFGHVARAANAASAGREGRAAEIGLGGLTFALPQGFSLPVGGDAQDVGAISYKIGFRPEDVLLARPDDSIPCLELTGILRDFEYAGTHLTLKVLVGTEEVRVHSSTHVRASLNQRSSLWVRQDRLHVFDAASGLCLM